MNVVDPDMGAGCCEGPMACVFAKALLARHARCGLAQRQQHAERTLLNCNSQVAHTNCRLLAELLHERARFALRLPPAGRPLMHAQSMRLQCGGLIALQQHLQAWDADVHGMVGLAQERHVSLTDLPWEQLVPMLASWQPPRRYVR